MSAATLSGVKRTLRYPNLTRASWPQAPRRRTVRGLVWSSSATSRVVRRGVRSIGEDAPVRVDSATSQQTADAIDARGDELSAESAASAENLVHGDARDHVEAVAPPWAPAIRLPFGGLLPWIGPGDTPLPAVNLESSDEWRERLGRVPDRARAGDALWAAWARDILGHSEAEVARDIGAALGEERHDAAERSATARERAKRGREMFRAAGVWPWAALADGERWPRAWWKDHRVKAALAAWASASWPEPPMAEATLVGTFSGRTARDLDEILETAELMERQALRRRPGQIRARVEYTWPGADHPTTTARITVRAREGALLPVLRFGLAPDGADPRRTRDGAPLAAAVAVTVTADPDDGRRGTYPPSH
jgi:hypothetical protein